MCSLRLHFNHQIFSEMVITWDSTVPFHKRVNKSYMTLLCMPVCTCVPTAFNSLAGFKFDRDFTGR